MEQTKLAATTRESLGKEASKKFKAQGSLPAVVYGGDAGPQSICVNSKDFEHVIRSKGNNVIITMDVDEGKDSQTVMVKDIQLHPVNLRPIHADFKRVDLNQDVDVEVPIKMEINAKGLKDGGILEHGLRTLHISCKPSIIPDEIYVDIKGLEIGHTLHVSDLQVAEGINIMSSPDQLIAAIIQPKAATSAAAAAEGEEEGAEGAEGTEKTEEKKAEE